MDGASDGIVRTARWLAAVLVLLPFVVMIVALTHVGSHFHAVSDQALEELLTRDVGRHAVLLGPFSRDTWSHPGPAMFYILAVPYWLTGGNSIGIWIGATFLNGVAVTIMLLIAKRHGGTSLFFLTALGLALLMRTLGAGFLRNPWNPYLPVLLFGALVFLVWAMACGDAWALPAGAAVATFCAQTHIGYVVMALPLFLGGAIWFLVGARHESRVKLARVVGLTVGILVVMWLPPIYEELTKPEGNLTRIVRYFQRPPPGPRYSMLHGYRLIASQLSLAPEWIRHVPNLRPLTAEAMALYHAPTPWLLVAFVASGIALFRLRRRGSQYDFRAWRLAVIVAASLVLGMLSIARTVGAAFAYRLDWALVLGMIALVVTIWGAWRVLASHVSPTARHAIAVCAVLVIGGVATVDVVAAATAPSPQSTRSSGVAALGAQLLANLPHNKGDVVVFSPDPITGYQPGLILWLERHGVAAKVLSFEGVIYGSHRVHARPPLRAVLTVASDAMAAKTAALPGERIIALVGDVPPEAQERVVAESEGLSRKYSNGKLDKREFGARNAGLIASLHPVTAVFLQDPAAGTSRDVPS